MGADGLWERMGDWLGFGSGWVWERMGDWLGFGFWGLVGEGLD